MLIISWNYLIMISSNQPSTLFITLHYSSIIMMCIGQLRASVSHFPRSCSIMEKELWMFCNVINIYQSTCPLLNILAHQCHNCIRQYQECLYKDDRLLRFLLCNIRFVGLRVKIKGWYPFFTQNHCPLSLSSCTLIVCIFCFRVLTPTLLYKGHENNEFSLD